MAEEYDLKRLREKFKALNDVYFSAICYAKVYEQLQIAKSPHYNDTDGLKLNLESINMYKGFFTTAESALFKEALLSLAKLFVPHDDALSIPRLLEQVKHDQSRIVESSEGGINFKPREFSQQELAEMQKELDNMKEAIRKLKCMRDRFLAHLDMRGVKEKDQLSIKEVEDLQRVAQLLINETSSKLLGEAAYYDEEEVEDDSKALIKLLTIISEEQLYESRDS